MKEMELLDLPDDLIPLYAVELDLSKIGELCSVNSRFNENICRNEHFWKMRFTRDFGFTPRYTGSWLKLYKNYQSVWAFGNNHKGQLGLGDIGSRSTPTMIPARANGGQLQIGFKAKAVACGYGHSLLIDLDDNVWSFGANLFGELGLRGRKAKAIAANGNRSMLIDLEDNVWFCGYYNATRTEPTMIPGIKAKAISTDSFASGFIDMDDNVWGFGNNSEGQLGVQNIWNTATPVMIPDFKAKAIAFGRDHTLAIDLDDNLWVFGSNRDGLLGLGDDPRRYGPTMIPLKVKGISTSFTHNGVIDLENNVCTFGSNKHGQLGLGDERPRFVPTMIPSKAELSSDSSRPPVGLKAKAISCGSESTLVIDLEDNLWAFGSNSSGTLGLGRLPGTSTPMIIPNLKAKAAATSSGFSLVIATMVTS